MSEDNSSVSQNEEIIQTEQDAETEALYEQFNVTKPVAEKKVIEMPDLSKGETEESEEDPDIDQDDEETKQPEATKKTLKAKYNGKELDVPEDEAREWIEKGMNLDKVRGQKTEYENALDEMAKLQGFKDHTELMANIPKLKEQQQQKKMEDFDRMKSDLEQEFIDNGLDPDKAQAYVDNHPLIKQARELIQQSEVQLEASRQQEAIKENGKRWDALYTKYPELVEESQGFTKGEKVAFYTPEMESRIAKGYDPIDAYELAHKDTIQQQSKKQMEQKLIKQQQLGNRAGIQSNTAELPDEPTLLPGQANLAAEFGVELKGVVRQQKLINSRR